MLLEEFLWGTVTSVRYSSLQKFPFDIRSEPDNKPSFLFSAFLLKFILALPFLTFISMFMELLAWHQLNNDWGLREIKWSSFEILLSIMTYSYGISGVPEGPVCTQVTWQVSW